MFNHIDNLHCSTVLNHVHRRRGIFLLARLGLVAASITAFIRVDFSSMISMIL